MIHSIDRMDLLERRFHDFIVTDHVAAEVAEMAMLTVISSSGFTVEDLFHQSLAVLHDPAYPAPGWPDANDATAAAALARSADRGRELAAILPPAPGVTAGAAPGARRHRAVPATADGRKHDRRRLRPDRRLGPLRHRRRRHAAPPRGRAMLASVRRYGRMASSLSAPLAAAATVDYPSSDGKPMAESDSQRIPLTYAVDRLRHYFRNHAEVYASGNLLIYYEEGNPGARVAPDVFVVFGARNVERSSYRLWEESKAPDFVLEITSRATWREDRTWKREAAARVEQEAAARRQEEAARQAAETRVQQEAAARQAAETRIQQEVAARRQEASARQAAENRVQREVAARQAAEARLAELEALLRPKGSTEDA